MKEPVTKANTVVTANFGLKPRYRGFSHMVAFVVAVILAPLLIVAAPGVGSRLIVGIYAATIVGLFGISALYHRRNWGPTGKRVMRRLDHSMIFLAIAGTYTPVTVFTLSDRKATIVLLVVWGGAIAGIVMGFVWNDAPAIAVAVPYVLIGWTAVFVAGDLWTGLGSAGFLLLAAGGALFTIGAAIYATRWPDLWPRSFGFHEVFHVFVIAGVAVHYVTVAFFALPKA